MISSGFRLWLRRGPRAQTYAHLAVGALLTGCYTTSVLTGAPAGPEQTDHQWFLLWGAARISGKSGTECGPAGVAWSETKEGPLDVALTLLLAAGVGGALALKCSGMPAGEDHLCAAQAFSTGAALSTLVATRTVNYACRVEQAPGYASPPPPRPQRPLPAPSAARPASPDDAQDETSGSEPLAPAPAPRRASPPAKASVEEPSTQAPSQNRKPNRLTDEECFDSDQCQRLGKCTSDGARCVAASNASCRQSLNCQLLKKCIARNGECVRP
jgi:hypothetical protein